MITSSPKSFNTETNIEPAVVVSLEDKLHQGRVQISPMSLFSVRDPSKLPWAKVLTHHSQHSKMWKTTHTYKVSDLVLVSRPTASDQDWIIEGHSGTIDDSDNMMTTAGSMPTVGDPAEFQPDQH